MSNSTKAVSVKADGTVVPATFFADNAEALNAAVTGGGGGGGGAVASVNGHTGEVMLTAADVGAPTTTDLTNGLANKASATRNISTGNSIQGGGDLTGDRTLMLKGDQNVPGAKKVYGTGADGVRGWQVPENLATNAVTVIAASGAGDGATTTINGARHQWVVFQAASAVSHLALNGDGNALPGDVVEVLSTVPGPNRDLWIADANGGTVNLGYWLVLTWGQSATFVYQGSNLWVGTVTDLARPSALVGHGSIQGYTDPGAAEIPGTANVITIDALGGTGSGVHGTFVPLFDATGSVGLWFNAGPLPGSLRFQLDFTSFSALSSGGVTSPTYTVGGSSGAAQFYLDPLGLGTGTGTQITAAAAGDAAAAIADLVSGAGIGCTAVASGDAVTVTAASAGTANAPSFATADSLLVVEMSDPGRDAATAPGGLGRTIEVDVANDADAPAIATAINAAFASDPGFTSSLSGNVVTLTDLAVGVRTAADAGASGLSVTTLTAGVDTIAAVAPSGDITQFELIPAVAGKTLIPIMLLAQVTAGITDVITMDLMRGTTLLTEFGMSNISAPVDLISSGIGISSAVAPAHGDNLSVVMASAIPMGGKIDLMVAAVAV